ncbi:MAG: hypothetical protein AAGU11_20025 [Syntrophobacteraceae bacterium]
MRKSDILFACLAVGLVLAGLAAVHSRVARSAASGVIELRLAMIKELDLTDLCLFTEARYTRHPSQADWHTPFQDHPMSLEHFPTGTIVGPPGWLRGTLDEPR